VINRFFVIHHFFLFGLVGNRAMDDGIASQLKKLVDDESAKVSGHIGGHPSRPALSALSRSSPTDLTADVPAG
jgi:hypothetical protein